MKFLSLILAISFYQLAFADILVLNFNKNNSTVAAAKRAAEKRGEKVIELPPNSSEQLDKDTFPLYLKKLNDQGVSLSSIVLSGHDGSGYFSGDSGSLNKIDLQKAFANYPEMAKKVNSLVLRGCYTGTVSQTMTTSPLISKYHWQKIFPELNLIAGYSDGAPSSEKIQSTSFIEEVLSLESEMYMANTLEELEKLSKSIPYSKYTSNSFTIRLCREPDETYYSNMKLQLKGIGFTNYEELIKLCHKKELEEALETYHSYLYAYEEKYSSPPKEHQGTKLRIAYSMIQENYHCLDAFRLADDGDQILSKFPRLIYYDYISENFQRHNETFLSQLKELLDWYNKESGEDLKLPDFREISRKEALEFIHKLHEISLVDYIGKDKPSFGLTHIEHQNISKLQTAATILNDSLFKLEEDYIPFDWVTTPISEVTSEEENNLEFLTFETETLLRDEESATLEGLSLNGAFEAYNKPSDLTSEKKDKIKSIIIQKLTSPFIKNLEGTQSPAEQLEESLFRDIRNYSFFITNPDNEINEVLARSAKVKSFAEEIKDTNPYESLLIAIKFPYYYSNEEIKAKIKKIEKHKDFQSSDFFVDIANSLLNFTGKKEHPFTELIKQEIPVIKEKLEELEKRFEDERNS